MPWDEAYNRSLKLSGPDDGFYLSLKVRLCYDKQTKPKVYDMGHCNNRNVMTVDFH